MLILKAQNIKKYYGDRLIFAFDDLKIYSGDRIGIVGQNGSGKTTLLNMLSGEIMPDEGIVRRLCDIAYIRQFSEESMLAEQRILKEFNLRYKEQEETLSGGEKTRVRIANALSKGSLLLFADEPTSSLDYKGIDLLKQKLDFSLINQPENKIVIYAENLSFHYGENQIFDNTGFKIYNGSKTAL